MREYDTWNLFYNQELELVVYTTAKIDESSNLIYVVCFKLSPNKEKLLFYGDTEIVTDY
jgi:hypothetical protein